MATRTVKARVELDGEKQYKQALSELQKGNQVLSSEMRRLQAEYKGNTESTEYLTKKGELLERQLLQQKDKVETLRQALQNAAAKYGESSEKTQEWQIKLNNAEAAEFDLEHAIEDNNKALDQQNQSMAKTEGVSKSLSVSVQDLAGQFGIKLPGGMDKALKGMKGFSAGAVSAISAVAVAVVALVKAETKLVDLTKEVAASADSVLTMSKITGLNTDTIQEMQYAANLVDVSFETIKSSLTKLKNAQQNARDGNKDLAETFRALGVEITNADGSLRNSEDVFYEMIDALGGIENATERDVIAMDVFGRAAEDLNPLILAGSDTLREYADEAHNVNYVLSGESLEALGAVDDAYQQMKMTQEATRKQLAEEMAPAVEELYKTWSSYISSTGKALRESGMIEGAATILESVLSIIPALEELVSAIIPDMKEGLSGIAQICNTIAWAIAGVADLIEFVEGLDPWNWGSGKLKNSLGFGYSSGNPSHLQSWQMKTYGSYDAYQDRYGSNSYSSWVAPDIYANGFYDSATGKWYDKDTGWEIPGYAAGTANWRGGLTWVGENGPELVNLPRGSQILNAQDSRNAGGTVFNITIPAKDIKEFNDIVRIAESAAVLSRMGG